MFLTFLGQFCYLVLECTGVIFLLYGTVSCKTDRKCGRGRMGSGQLLKNGTETLQFWMHGLQPTL